jgi:arsenate reductase
LSKIAGDEFETERAGLYPAAAVNPLVVEVMAEEGVDLSAKKPRSVFDLFKAGRLYDYVVTVCDDTNEKLCPVFPGLVVRWHWPFPDPAGVIGARAEQLAQVRMIREAIKKRVEDPLRTFFRAEDPFVREA